MFYQKQKKKLIISTALYLKSFKPINANYLNLKTRITIKKNKKNKNKYFR
jgi:hypothetical protein